MISAIKLKKCATSAGILGIIVSELRYKKKLCLIILLKVDQGLKLGFYYSILPFGLPVCLEIKSGEESLLHA